MSVFLDFVGYICILLPIILMPRHAVDALGGSIFLLVLFPASVFLSHFWKLKRGKYFMDVVLLCLLCLNVLNFGQTSDLFSPQLVFTLYNTLVALMLIALASILVSSLQPTEEDLDGQQAAILIRNFKWIAFWYPTLAFGYSLLLSIVFLVVTERRYAATVPLQMVHTVFFVVPMLLCFMILAINDWGEYKLDFVLRKDVTPSRDLFNPKRAYAVLMIVVGAGGTILEVFSRNDLCLWFESLATASIVLLVARKMYIHRNSGQTYQELPHEETITTPEYLVKTSLINAGAVVGLSIALLYYLMHY